MSQEEKKVLTWYRNNFSLILKGFQLSEIVSHMGVDL